jgi:integrase/recombinase XerD
MLEYWYKERRTLADFRRGPLGPHMDGFAAHLKRMGYSSGGGVALLGKCCLFNSFLIEKGVADCEEINDSLISGFLDSYLENYRSLKPCNCTKRSETEHAVRRLLSYLRETGFMKDAEESAIPEQYRWVLEPYLRYLEKECCSVEKTIQRKRVMVSVFLEGLGKSASPAQMKALSAEAVEQYLLRHFKESLENRRSLSSTLRCFLRYCADRKVTACDLSSMVPAVPSYRLASLPRGMEDSALQRMLNAVPKDTPAGLRDYAVMLLMMAYGIRAISAVKLLLEDINWTSSTVRIRARKGGKEVVVPLLDAVGEAILRYLKIRPETVHREVFMTVRAPVVPLNGGQVSVMVRKYMLGAGVHPHRGGSHTLRHSWAIRALAHDAPIKAIADVLGHRCLNTTFIYAKADLKMLRQVAMPWPEGR